MDNKKFEKLIDLIINENEDKARELFHQIVVEKSREIYESIMDEEMMADEEQDDEMGGEVGGLMAEITAEESGVMEDDEEMEGEEEVEYDFSDDEDAGEEHEEAEEDLADEVHDLEDRVVSIEDKLDDLLAQFEAEMGGEEEEEGAEEEEMGDEEEEEGEEEAMMEAVQLQAVRVTHGDGGAQKDSPTAFNSGQAGMGSKPVNFSGGGQEKGRSAPSTKDVKGAGAFANAPGKGSRDLGKAPAPQKSQASGVNTKSPVAHK